MQEGRTGIQEISSQTKAHFYLSSKYFTRVIIQEEEGLAHEQKITKERSGEYFSMMIFLSFLPYIGRSEPGCQLNRVMISLLKVEEHS